MTDEQLLQASTEEIKKLHDSGAGVRVEMSPVEAFQILGLLQLALRHPGVQNDRDSVREAGIRIAKQIEDKFAKYPATAEAMRRGWHAEYDHLA